MRAIGILLFNDFEMLDVAGPLEVFGHLNNEFKLTLIASTATPIRSAQGARLLADADFNSTPKLDIFLVPGGMGTRHEVNNPILLSFIQQQANTVPLVLSVCTGAALLAKAGVLDGLSATSNKLAFDWVMTQSQKVDWQREPRWVDAGRVITSAGIAAGIDMSLYVVGKLLGEQTRDEVSRYMEYP